MGSIFRIARAELIKIFKRPTVYIMAFLLAAVIGGSLFLFEPVKREKTTVDMGTITTSTTAKSYFDKFDKDVTFKTEFDRNTTSAKAEISFYKNINLHQKNLRESYAKLVELLQELKGLENTKITATHKTELITAFTTYITDFENADKVSDGEQPIFVQTYLESPLYDTIHTSLTDNKNSLDAFEPQNIGIYLKNDSNYSKILTNVEDSFTTALDPVSAYLKSSISTMENILKEFYTDVGLGAGGTTQANAQRRLLAKEIERYEAAVKNILEYDQHTFAVIVKDDYDSFKNNISIFFNAVNIKDTSEPNLKDNRDLKLKIENENFVNKISTVIGQIILLNCDEELLDELNKTTEVIDKRVSDKYKEINSFASKNASSKDVNVLGNLNNMISEYKAMQVSLKNFVYYSIQNETLKDYSNSDIQEFFGDEFYDVYNKYQNSEKIIQNKYYIDNDIYSFELGNVFAFGVNSADETTPYDFMYYATEISTMVIIIFSIFMAASIFAAEHDSGTIKLLLIRPFKRHKIVTGKLLATLFFSTMFLVFSTVVSTIIGFTTFSTDATTPILAVFNGSVAFKFNPMILFAIYLFFSLIEIIFYVILSSTLCTLFKSYAGAVTGSFVAYFATIAMNMGLGSKLWYSYSPFVNLNLFKYFGNGFISNPNSTFAGLFSTPMLGNMNYFLSLGLSAGLMALLLAITYVVFKRRDY